MKFKTTLAIVSATLMLAACGKSEEPKPSASDAKPAAGLSRIMEDNIVVPAPDRGENPLPKRGSRF